MSRSHRLLRKFSRQDARLEGVSFKAALEDNYRYTKAYREMRLEVLRPIKAGDCALAKEPDGTYARELCYVYAVVDSTVSVVYRDGRLATYHAGEYNKSVSINQTIERLYGIPNDCTYSAFSAEEIKRLVPHGA